MNNIYDNLEPNELTSLFPQLSEKQLSSIGGGGNNDNKFYADDYDKWYILLNSDGTGLIYGEQYRGNAYIFGKGLPAETESRICVPIPSNKWYAQCLISRYALAKRVKSFSIDLTPMTELWREPYLYDISFNSEEITEINFSLSKLYICPTSTYKTPYFAITTTDGATYDMSVLDLLIIIYVPKV